MRQSIFKREFIGLILLAAFLCGNFSVFAQTKKRTATVKPAAVKQSGETKTITGEILVSEKNQAMSAAWTSGQLPQPLALPAGNTDEVAAMLAQKVAAKTEESIPALLTALQLSGFFVTNKDGSTFLAPPDGKGQGLTINGWEIASAAKMFGGGRQTTLNDLDGSLKLIPFLNQAKAGDKILDGLRRHADNQTNPYLRVWARFTIELGKNSAAKYDITANAKAEDVTLDAVQNLIILRRLYGDLFAAAEKYKNPTRRAASESNQVVQFVNANFSKDSNAFQFTEANYDYSEIVENRFAPADEKKEIPCKMDGDAPIVMDAVATASGIGFGELIGYLEGALPEVTGDALGKYSKVVGIANILLAYAKFLQTYAALETTLTLEDGAPLVRTKNSTPGARKNLKAEVRMNIGNWQIYNCFRTAINLIGIDFATVNDGPAGGIGVTWHLDEGGGKDVYSNAGGLTGNEQIVGLTQGGGRIQDQGTSAGTRGANRVGNQTYTKTDGDGVARMILEGSPQRNAKIGKLNTVMKRAKVRTTVKMKAGDLKGESVDVAGQFFGGLPGLITMPLELLYRMDWASTASLVVPVQDWEECEGGWYGTITYTKTETSQYSESLPGGSKGGNMRYVAQAEIKLNGEDAPTAKTTVDYSKFDFVNTSGKECCWISMKGCTREGTVSKEDIIRTAISANDTRELEPGTGKINIGGNNYFFSASIGKIKGTGNTHYTFKRKRECEKQNENSARDQAETRDYAISIEFSGTINPENPDVISGSKTDGDVTITWNLKRCR